VGKQEDGGPSKIEGGSPKNALLAMRGELKTPMAVNKSELKGGRKSDMQLYQSEARFS